MYAGVYPTTADFTVVLSTLRDAIAHNMSSRYGTVIT